MRFSKFLSKNAYLLFSIAGSAGVILTAVACGKATLKASEIIRDKQTKNESTVEIAKSVYKYFVPSAIFGIGSIACITASTVCSKKQIAALTAAYISMSDACYRYRDQVKKLYGDNAPQELRDAAAKDAYEKDPVEKPKDDETLLWYDEYHEKLFNRKMIEVIDAEYQLNRKFVKEGEVSLNDFFHFLALDDHPEGDILGWSLEADCAFFGYNWIEFEHELVQLEDGMECRILRMVTPPYAGYDCPF